MKTSVFKGYFTGVGSRETPPVILQVMELIGEVLCTLGWCGRSGLAPGADRAFYYGAQRSPAFHQIGFENYLPNDWYFNREKFGYIKPNSDRMIFNAQAFKDVYDRAQAMALAARGSWNGLVQSGIELHTRNAFQVMGRTLDTPSRFTVLWAEPIGRQGKVRGGTNTANVISQKHGVEVLNLYHSTTLKKMWSMIVKHYALLSPDGKKIFDSIKSEVEGMFT